MSSREAPSFTTGRPSFTSLPLIQIEAPSSIISLSSRSEACHGFLVRAASPSRFLEATRCTACKAWRLIATTFQFHPRPGILACSRCFGEIDAHERDISRVCVLRQANVRKATDDRPPSSRCDTASPRKVSLLCKDIEHQGFYASSMSFAAEHADFLTRTRPEHSRLLQRNISLHLAVARARITIAAR